MTPTPHTTLRVFSWVALATMATVSGKQTPPRNGLVLWLDAADTTTVSLDGEYVQAWASKAPGTEHRFVAEGKACPVYIARPDTGARNALRFDGIDDALRCSHFGLEARRWTLVVVTAPFSSGRDGALCSACPSGGNDFDPGFTVDLYGSGTQFDQISIEGAGRIGGQKNQMRNRFPYGAPHVITVERDDHTVRLYIDGTLEGTRPVQPATTVMEELRVGARFYGGAERCYFNGEVFEIFLYDRVLGPRERVRIGTSRCVTKHEQTILEKAFMQARREQRRNRMIAPRLVHAWPSIETYDKQAGKSIRALPIRTDLRKAIRLCVRHLNSLYDADRDNEPYFYADMRPDGTGVLLHSLEIGVPHVVGRCLLGCMMAEQKAGVPFPTDGLTILERYCRSSFDTPYHLNAYVDPARDGKQFVELHNVREGLYGLWALITGRNSEWARETARKMVRTLDAMTDERGRWNVDLAAKAGLTGVCTGMSVPNAARTVDPLLAYYTATKDPVAMKLAGLYARAGLEEMFDANGRFTAWEKSSGHVHSITSALSGITEYAILTADKAMLARCRKIVDHGMPEYFSSWGWGDEVFPDHPADERSRGEINQTGDVIRTALLLGDAGYTEYYELAERFVRSMLLPTQHRRKEMQKYMRENANPAHDSERNIVERCVGGYAMQLPNDRMKAGGWPISTLDITSGAVHAFSEFYAHRCVSNGTATRVNLLFDYDGPEVTVRSGLPVRGVIEFTAKTAREVNVRVPPWVDPETLRLIADGRDRTPTVENGYVRINGLAAGIRGSLSFSIPVRIEKETVDGIEYTTTWLGSQVIDILPHGPVSPLPFDPE